MIDRITLHWLYNHGKLYAIGEEHSTIYENRLLFFQLFTGGRDQNYDPIIKFVPFAHLLFFNGQNPFEYAYNHIYNLLDRLNEADFSVEGSRHTFQHHYTYNNEHTVLQAQNMIALYEGTNTRIYNALFLGNSRGTIVLL